MMVSMDVEAWLVKQGHQHERDYEILIEPLQTKNTQNVGILPGQVKFPLQPIFFFNDASIATYVKLTWGGL
jgi:hypothetical protein